MSMLMLALMHTGMHVYVREKRRREQRKREFYIHIHCVPCAAADVKRCREMLTGQREIFNKS